MSEFALPQRGTLGVPAAPPARLSDGFFSHHGVWAPGVRLFRQLHFSAKAALISLALVLPLLALVLWQVSARNAEALQARLDNAHAQTAVAHGILTWAHAAETSGAMNREQAQAAAKKAISGLRYGNNEYFWINDMTPRVVMHPIKPELDGKDVSDVKDPSGLPLFKAFVDVVRAHGEGPVSYLWPTPGEAEPVPKISYVMGFEPWGWVVGTGVYTGDLTLQARRNTQSVLVIVVASVLLGSYLFYSFYLVMAGGLREVRRHLRAMREGDLTESPSPWGRDELAALMLDMAQMQEALRAMVLQVRASSDTIVHASAEIAEGAMDLSARTEQTAANLEESASAMEEISSTVKLTAQHAHSATRIAEANAAVAARGGQVMGQMVRTMEEIHASSSKIGDIIGTIDGIAFQTNILALNAAVEAARAGDAGRGFAVVASEVRSLAQRSAAAAREIKSLINDSVERVQAGTGVVKEAGSTIDEVVAGAQRINQLLSDIANGATEQSLGIEQVGLAVNDLDHSTQQNAALVEETAAAATAMRSQAQSLAGEVARFKLPAGVEEQFRAHEQTTQVSDFNFEAAIDAHRAWKVKLRSAIASRERLDADKICLDNQCPLGQWLHGPGGKQWGHKPSFVALVGKHADFHRAAGEVARQINAGRGEQAERMLGSGTPFSQASTEVATLLTQAKRGL